MPESSAEVIAAGINTVDFLARPPGGVIAGGKYETDELDVQGGGPASTASCITAAFGHATAFVARLGDDPSVCSHVPNSPQQASAPTS